MILAVAYLIIAPLILAPLAFWLFYAQRDIPLRIVWRRPQIVPLAVGLCGVTLSLFALCIMVLHSIPVALAVAFVLTLALLLLLFERGNPAQSDAEISQDRRFQTGRDMRISGFVTLGFCGWLLALQVLGSTDWSL